MNTIATSSFIILKGLEGNTPMILDPLQQFMGKHTEFMITLWWTVWCATLLYLTVRFIVIPVAKKVSLQNKGY